MEMKLPQRTAERSVDGVDSVEGVDGDISIKALEWHLCELHVHMKEVRALDSLQD